MLNVYPAGAELNFAIGLERLGIQSAFFGGAGNDVWGRRIKRTILAEGVKNGLTVIEDLPTAVMFRDSVGPKGAIRVHYLRKHGACAVYQGGLGLTEALSSAVGLHFTGISLNLSSSMRDTCLKALESVRPGAVRSFDLNVRLQMSEAPTWRRAWADVRDHVDIGFATRDELTAVGLDAEDMARSLNGHDGVMVLRDGTGPTAVWMPEGRLDIPQPQVRVEVRDTVGAGDAFDAATVAYRLDGAGWEQAVTAGHWAGAFVVGSYGDFQGAPNRQELGAVLEGHWTGR